MGNNNRALPSVSELTHYRIYFCQHCSLRGKEQDLSVAIRLRILLIGKFMMALILFDERFLVTSSKAMHTGSVPNFLEKNSCPAITELFEPYRCQWATSPYFSEIFGFENAVSGRYYPLI